MSPRNLPVVSYREDPQAMMCTQFVKTLALSLPPNYDSYLYTGLESAAPAAPKTLDTAPSLATWISAGRTLLKKRQIELSAGHCVLGPTHLWGRTCVREMRGHQSSVEIATASGLFPYIPSSVVPSALAQALPDIRSLFSGTQLLPNSLVVQTAPLPARAWVMDPPNS